MRDIKYLTDGTAVHVIQELTSGFLVQKLYEYGDPEDEPISDGLNPMCVPQVFDVAPTAIYDERVNVLQARIEELETKRKELDQRERESASAAKELAAKLARNDQLKHLFDYIDGKITHYVEDDWGGPKIIEFQDSTCRSSNEYEKKERRALKLLSLFGDSKGILNWRLNYYKDGSGGSTNVWPVRSYQEGLDVVRRLLAERMANGPRADVVKVADQYGIEIPAEYRTSVKVAQIEGLRARIAKNDEERDKLAKELGVIESEV